MKIRRAASFNSLLLGIIFLLLMVPAFGARRGPFVIHPDKFMVSAPLSESVAHSSPLTYPEWREREEVEHEPPGVVKKIYSLPDPVIQESSFPSPELGVTIGFNFDGVDGSNAGGVSKPDTNGAVGDTQYFMITNFAFQIYNKSTGESELGPALINTIFTGFGGPCENDNGGDPVVLYDKMANRWLLEQAQYDPGTGMVCVAVSQTDDATGKYNLYSYTFNGVPDYPKLGIWPDAYYLSFNFFRPPFHLHAEACALDRTTMIQGGQNPVMVCFNPNRWDATADVSFLPSDMDGSTPPPKGAPNHYVELGYTNTTINEFDFHVDFQNTSKSTFKGPRVINVPAHTQTCVFFCIPQPDNGILLEALSDRLMFRNAYRNFGDHESMAFSHTVAPGSGSTAVAAERWYEMRATPAGSKFKMYQGGTYQNKTDNRWMGSLAMDKNGDIAFGFSVDNSSSLDPSIGLTGRVPTDPKNKLESSLVVKKGTKIQGTTGWGDYSSMSVDPSDDCTMWYTQEYSNGGSNWQSHVVSFKFNSCQ